MLSRARTKFQLLEVHPALALLLLAVLLFLLHLVLELGVLHQPHHRGLSVWRDQQHVHLRLLCNGSCLLEAHHAKRLALNADDAHLFEINVLIDGHNGLGLLKAGVEPPATTATAAAIAPSPTLEVAPPTALEAPRSSAWPSPAGASGRPSTARPSAARPIATAAAARAAAATTAATAAALVATTRAASLVATPRAAALVPGPTTRRGTGAVRKGWARGRLHSRRHQLQRLGRASHTRSQHRHASARERGALLWQHAHPRPGAAGRHHAMHREGRSRPVGTAARCRLCVDTSIMPQQLPRGL
mmetsp:Transcript_17090/g.42942  ORF Transcript_17090/g.42942 Transcript_17090/m.42942 type:complete len:302 (-) Transcript_17090:47-952(-)